MKIIFFGFILFLSSVLNAQKDSTSGPLVITTSGILRGITHENVASFKGIPYAAPPVGPNRWRPPQPVTLWKEVRDATRVCADCPQRAWPGSTATISEDCLFLNVWAPATATKKSKLPVMVWIHGGGFTGGSGSGPGSAGDAFAKQGVILTTINYRLGRLGHFAFPALSKEHTEESKGSYAYMDQIAALRWVQENIAALAKLRSLSVKEIVDGGQENDSTSGRIYSGPILDGKLVVETAESAYKAGRQARVPLIIGNCSAEIGGPFVNNSTSKEALFSLFGELETDAKAAFDPDGNKEFAEIITKFNTDWVWGEPARMAARAFVAQRNPVYMYQFGYVPPLMRERARYGAGHGSEISYVFNTLDARWGPPAEATPNEKGLAMIMNTYWANFAKTGNPNGKGLPSWPLYDTQKEEILDIDLEGKPVSKPDPRKAKLNVIEKAFKQRDRLQLRGI